MTATNKRTSAFYIRILAATARGPVTSKEIREKLNASQIAMREALRAMRDAGLIHIDAYLTSRGTPALWLIGPGPDAPAPPHIQMQATQPNRRKILRSNMIAFVTIIKAIQETAMTRDEMRDVSGLAELTVQRIVDTGRECGVLYVADYDRPREAGAWAECFRFGIDMPDAPRPVPISQREQEHRWSQRRTARKGMLKVIQAIQGRTLEEA